VACIHSLDRGGQRCSWLRWVEASAAGEGGSAAVGDGGQCTDNWVEVDVDVGDDADVDHANRDNAKSLVD